MGFFGGLLFGFLRLSIFGFEIGVGYIFPLAKTLQMICSNPKEFSQAHLQKWLTYWMTIALLSFFIFPIFSCSCLPSKLSFFFAIIRSGIHGYLVLTDKATQLLYEKLFKDNKGVIDAILDKLQIQCNALANKLGIMKQKEEKKEE